MIHIFESQYLSGRS